MSNPTPTGGPPPPQSGARTVHTPGPLKKKPATKPKPTPKRKK